MNIKSLGYRTDFIFNKFDGSVTDKGTQKQAGLCWWGINKTKGE